MPTQDQLSDLAELHAVAKRFAANVTIIGATALECFIELPRLTYDIDLVVALDFEDFAAFAAALQSEGWVRQERREHRWRGPRASIIDILPAGPGLRAARQLIWPEGEFAMSLVGFEHVFSRAVEVTFGNAIRYHVAPPAVIALLKIVAYMEDQQRRQKDLQDLRILFHRYEATTDRVFSDEVFAADLEDIEFATAFLLGLDVGVFVTNEEAAIVQTFFDRLRISADELAELDPEDYQQRETRRFQQQLRAFYQGVTSGSDSLDVPP